MRSAKGLLQSLVLRAQCFCFYDLSRSCVWSSDGGQRYAQKIRRRLRWLKSCIRLGEQL